MTIAGKRIRRLTLVAVVLAFVLEGIGCDGDTTGGSILNKVLVKVTKAGAGTGRVISSDITTAVGTVINLDCGPSRPECEIEFQDAGGGGTLTLTATPDPGSVFGDPLWAGTCTPTDPECTVTPANGTAALAFPSSDSVLFSVTVTFDLAPSTSVPTDLIVFESSRDVNREIYVIKPDGTGLTRLTTNPGQDREPVWSPARTKIAFVSDRAPHNGNDEIYEMLADGTSPVRLTNSSGEDRRPAYSPDGNRIAFDNDADSDDEVFVMNVDGTGVTQLTFNTSNFDQGPSWSPNSMQILFTTFRDGRDNLYVMDADGMNQTLLVNTGVDDYQPDWSPDGARIVFTSQDGDGDDEIFVVDADGTSNLKQLTSNTVPDREATWSSDSKWIAFASDRGGNRDIYIMTPDGQNVMRVTTHAANDQRPSWVH